MSYNRFKASLGYTAQGQGHGTSSDSRKRSIPSAVANNAGLACGWSSGSHKRILANYWALSLLGGLFVFAEATKKMLTILHRCDVDLQEIDKM